MSIYSEIDRLELAKQNLKLKLESKGITVPANARISDYAALINLLPEIKESEFTNRIVDNGNSGTGKAKIYNIKGKSLVWNQLVANAYYINAQTDTRETLQLWGMWNNSTVVINDSTSGNHHYILTPPASITSFLLKHNGKTQDFLIFKVDVVAGHKMYLHYNTIKANPTIVGGVEIDGIQFIDLTLLYGTTIDGLTDEQILAKYEAEFGTGYHEYNAGTLINNDAEAIESIGFNQWDEEVEEGIYSEISGEKIQNNQFYRCKNYIPALPNTDYYYKSLVSNTRVLFYNSNKNLIGSNNTLYNKIFTTPDSCYYITFYYIKAEGGICINLSNPAKNGTYEPYKKFTLPLNLNSFDVKDDEDNIITVNGLKSAGNVYDEIVGNKYIQRVGSVDMGTLTWTSLGPYANTPKSVINVLRETAQLINNAGLTLLGSGVATTLMSITQNNTSINVNVDGDGTNMATKLSGKYLYYELATPIEYELVDEIDTIYDVDKDGVERIVSPVHQDGSPSAPFRASIGYPVNQE